MSTCFCTCVIMGFRFIGLLSGVLVGLLVFVGIVLRGAARRDPLSDVDISDDLRFCVRCGGILTRVVIELQAQGLRRVIVVETPARVKKLQSKHNDAALRARLTILRDAPRPVVHTRSIELSVI